MSITNLSNQYISSSFAGLVQYSSSNQFYDGLGSLITTMSVSLIQGTCTTASYISPGFITGSVFPYTGSAGISGSLQVNGTTTLGLGLTTVRTGQTVVGINNVNVSRSLFTVGSGIVSPSNAMYVTDSGSVVLPITASAIPAWSGSNGEFVFGTTSGGAYVMYVWIGGRWRSGSLNG